MAQVSLDYWLQKLPGLCWMPILYLWQGRVHSASWHLAAKWGRRLMVMGPGSGWMSLDCYEEMSELLQETPAESHRVPLQWFFLG